MPFKNAVAWLRDSTGRIAEGFITYCQQTTTFGLTVWVHGDINFLNASKPYYATERRFSLGWYYIGKARQRRLPTLPSLGRKQGQGKTGTSAQDTEADYKARLVSLYANCIFGKYLHKGVEILRDPSLSSNEKLKRLSSLKMIHPDASASTLAKALNVKAGTVKKTEWWKSHMANRWSQRK